MYIKYKTHIGLLPIYQHNQLYKNTLQYGSSTSEARDLLNLLSDVKLMLFGSGMLVHLDTLGQVQWSRL